MLAPAALDFVPRRLAAAVQKAIELHPGTAAAPAPIPSDGLAALQRRVAQARGDRERLEALGRELSPRQVRALVTGLEQWEELRAETADLLLARGRAGLVEPLWRSWQRFPRVDAIRVTLLQLAERFGWSAAVGEPFSALAPRWVKVVEPGVEIQGWLDAQGRSYSDMSGLRTPLLDGTPLMTLIRAATLTHGSARQLHAEGVLRMLEWARELGPAQLVLFRKNYLLKVGAADWDLRILEPIAAAYGLPRRPRIPAFWAPLPEDVRTEFQRLFIQRRLEKAFAGDTDRHEYWKRWAAAFADVEMGDAAGTEYAVLRFERFGVIEFFQIGHAAFFYPHVDLDPLVSRPIVGPGSLKKRDDTALNGVGNRLVHIPSGGWYYKADSMVRQWMRILS
jgi:hypothetical protein